MGIVSKIKWRLQTRSISRLARRLLEAHLTYLAVEKLERMEKAIAETRGLRGDVIEFGVALGGSAILLAHGAGPDRRFIGFDVFAMIPEPSSDKDDEKSKQRYETIRSGQSRGIAGERYYGYLDDLYERVRASFAAFGMPVDDDRVRLIKGLFEETWPTAGVGPIALAHLDCDWYDPVRFCLSACADRMLPGGQIIIDDYHAYGGCRTAVDEFLAAHSDFRMVPGRNPILHRL